MIAYLRNNKESPALKSVIARVVNDANYGVFVRQALTARSWYDITGGQIGPLLNTAIEKVLNGAADSARALGEAQDTAISLTSH